MIVEFTLNGSEFEVDCSPGQTLLELLREIGHVSVKYGCDFGECGACTVLIDNKAQNACLTLMHTVHGQSVETLEGLNEDDAVKNLQDAFLDEGAIQCGYCTPGMLMSIEALRRENVSPSEQEIRDTLTGNLCRCTGYVKPVKAALKYLNSLNMQDEK